jgi:hypothetical protein
MPCRTEVCYPLVGSSNHGEVGPCSSVAAIVIPACQCRDADCSAPVAEALCWLSSARWPEARGRRELRHLGLGFRRLIGLPFALSQTIRSYNSFHRKSAVASPSNHARVPICPRMRHRKPRCTASGDCRCMRNRSAATRCATFWSILATRRKRSSTTCPSAHGQDHACGLAVEAEFLCRFDGRPDDQSRSRTLHGQAHGRQDHRSEGESPVADIPTRRDHPVDPGSRRRASFLADGRPGCMGCCDDPKLGKMGTDRIDHRGLLADGQMAGAMEPAHGGAEPAGD